MNHSSKPSILFRVTATLTAAVFGVLGLALLAALTGGAILAPLCFATLFAPLLAVQYLLWGRFLNRTLLDDGHPLDDLEVGQSEQPFAPTDPVPPSVRCQPAGDGDKAVSPSPANR